MQPTADSLSLPTARNRFRILAVLPTTLILISLAAGAQPRGDLPALPAPTLSADRIREVQAVEADLTVVLRSADASLRVRLIGVAAPRERDCSEASARYLGELLRGECVYVVQDLGAPLPDEHQRLPVYLYRAPDGLFVNLELIRAGYALVEDRDAFACTEAFHAYEIRAQESKKGIWANPADASGAKQTTARSDKSRPQTAKSAPAASQPSNTARGGNETIVYVTPSGGKYHRKDCQHVRKNGKPISLAEAHKRYQPCSQCKPPQ